MLLVALVLFQFINCLLAQTTTCSTLTCLNGGTCWNSTTMGPVCNCTRFYQGFFCEQKLPTFIWTLDEMCRRNFGRDYYSPMTMSVSTCSYLMCKSFSDPFNFMTIDNADGLLCGPGAICMNQTCQPVQNAPQVDVLDKMVGNITCQEYLNNSTLTFAKRFCSDPMAMARCPISCRKFAWLNCDDQLRECSYFGSFCNFTYGNSSLIRNVCPYTCNTCPNLPMRCMDGLCLNGATCQNTTVPAGSKFGFRCVCPPGFVGEYCESINPCTNTTCSVGRRCNRIGTMNYICS